MLRSTNDLIGYRLNAIDETIGTIQDFYVDDDNWVIRYMVADTGAWLPGRKVLLSPCSMGEPDWNSRSIPVSLTKQQIEMSPPIESDQPVSRQNEAQLVGYYSWPIYWAPAAMPTTGVVAADVGAHLQNIKEAPAPKTESQDVHLRSVDELKGYHIHATDGEIGHVDDSIVQTDEWSIRYFVVDTRNWLPGKKVLMSPLWIDRISWSEQMVYMKMSRESIRNAPAYDPSTPVNREYEETLYDYYGMPHYW